MSEGLQAPRPTIKVESITESDIRQALMGQPGNPTYEEQFGMTSAPLGETGMPAQPSLAQLELEAEIARARATNPNAFAELSHIQEQAPQGLPDEAEKWKQLYGQSENEKGAARKREAELTEAFNGLMAQFESLQASQTQSQWGPSPQAQQFGPQVGYGQNSDPFAGIDDDDVVQGRQIKTLVQEQIGPAMNALIYQQQEALKRTSALERQLLEQARSSAGVSKLDEFRLVAKNPWINGMGQRERIQALAALKQSEAATNPAPIAPTPQATESQNRILNKVTYIEGANPQVADTSVAAIEASKQRDYAKVMAANAETGERARLFRQFALKYNLNIGRATSDLAR